MNKKLRVPGVSLLIGIILNLVRIFIDYIIGQRAMDITSSMNSRLIRFELIFTIILMVLAGLFLFRDMTREEIFKSGVIMSIYFGLMSLLQSVFLRNGIYSSLISILFLPINPYLTLFSFLKIILNWSYPLAMIISILTPISFTIFPDKS